MTTSLSRRAWLQRSAMAAAILPVSKWYVPDLEIRNDLNNPSGAAIKLNSNENAYGPGPASMKAMVESLGQANRYPWDIINGLRNAIAGREDVSPDHVLVTAGSTEILALAGLAFGLHKGEMLACDPTFDFLMRYAEKFKCKWKKIPVAADFQYDLNAISDAAGKKTRLIFICNPNNPTGMEIPNDTLKSFCTSHAAKYPIYIDEAYIEFSSRGKESSMVSLVDQYPNLIIGRTFSKIYGLAGMRIGYAIAHPDTIAKLDVIHQGRGMNISVAAAAGAIAALTDPGFETMVRGKVIEGRNLVNKAFDQWGVKYLPSATNFIFFRNEKFTANPQKAMEQENILIRNYDNVEGWSRVSIGKVEEMKQFVEAMGKYV
ncbi:MAG TPA: histidinol-phosphate transaminase [Saprospiraceae bacterium]|nr:histidinol-phosphate transaminase [Saprospiraceae bacterium]